MELSVLESRTAGDPDDARIVFTDLSAACLSLTMTQMGTPVCAEVIRHWMEEQDLRLRKIAKDLAGGHSPDREAQFERIAELIAAYEAAGNPYFSIDTKAKEYLGKLFRAGRVRSTQAFRAFDHDFPSWADGVLIPHGIYDRVRNRGHINLGNSAKVALSSDVVGIQQVVSSARKVDLLGLTSLGNLSHMRHFPAYRVSLAVLPLRSSCISTISC